MTIFCVGRNYTDHAKELGNAVPKNPVIFLKPATALLPNHSTLIYPSFTNALHYEGELVIKIAKTGKNIAVEDTLDFYKEMTIGIDFTARDLQNQLKNEGLPWEKSKAFDGSAAIGRFIQIPVSHPHQPILFSLHRNHQLVQAGTTADMLFSIADLIADISKYFTLQAGDLIYTGTPAGVGLAHPGDSFEGFIGQEQILKIGVG